MSIKGMKKAELVGLCAERGWNSSNCRKLTRRELIVALELDMEPQKVGEVPEERQSYPGADDQGEVVPGSEDGPDLTFVDMTVADEQIKKAERKKRQVSRDSLSEAFAEVRRVRIGGKPVAAARGVSDVMSQMAWANSSGKAGVVLTVRGKINRGFVFVASEHVKVAMELVNELAVNGLDFEEAGHERVDWGNESYSVVKLRQLDSGREAV